MRLHVDRAHLRTALFATAFVLALPYSIEASSQTVTQINLVTDNQDFLTSQGFSAAANVDPNLINPWGMSFSTTSPFWISDQGTGVSTLYNANGVPQSLIVTIPGSATGPSGPTGQVFNGTSDFQLTSGNSARFIFANLDGTISGWNPNVNPTNAIVAATTAGAVYTGLASGSNSAGNFLFAANNAAGRIDVFNGSFQPTSLTGSFVDPNLPAGLAPFNVVNIGGTLYVTYTTPGPDADEAPLGTGIVDRFTTDGVFLDRFVTGSTSNNVLSPWGVVQAPDDFGAFASAILVGNFAEEDGFINAFTLNGTYLGMLMLGSDPFNVPYLWALGTRADGSGFDSSAVYFTAGIGEEEHGLFGRLNSVPEPATWAMMLMGFGAVGLAMRRRRQAEVTFRRAV
jgi:uncharacterized protein (TIGR03118 family)